MINSNLGDVPEAYKQYCIVLSDKVKGTGKERDIARKIAIEYLDSVGNNKVDSFVDDADLVCVVNSTEGGTGSGSSSVLYKYLLNVSNKNVMGFVFTGFEEDGRGLKNTVEYFKDMDETIALQIISNRKFLPLLGKNKLRAEKMANEEFVRRLAIVSGREMVESAQNIDRTDLLKIVTTPGYLMAEYMELTPPPQNMSQFNRLLEDMIAESKALPTNETAKRIGVILIARRSWKRRLIFRLLLWSALTALRTSCLPMYRTPVLHPASACWRPAWICLWAKYRRSTAISRNRLRRFPKRTILLPTL